MKLSTSVGYTGDPRKAAQRAKDLESAGIDMIWVAELYSFDAISILGYLAAHTERMELGTSIMPIYSRTPTLIAMTAAGLDAVSDGRFVLGLGTSGPQVIEGWHGVPFDKPLTRTREVIDICRLVWKRERVVYHGEVYSLPLPKDLGTGLGKPLKIINRPVRDDIPVYIASLGPKNVQLTAEIADGWLPAFFHPDKARDVFGADLEVGSKLPRPVTCSARDRGGRHRRYLRRRYCEPASRLSETRDRSLRRRNGREGPQLLQQCVPSLRVRAGGRTDPRPLPRRPEGRSRSARPRGLPRGHVARRR